MDYSNFRLAIYCRVGDLNAITDLGSFEKAFSCLEKHLKIGKVYLESYRSGEWISRERMLEFKRFFEGRGILTSGGITTTSERSSIGFEALCYTGSEHRERLKKAVELTASIFGEVILDDFYFTNCKCESCIKARGSRSWAEFRTSLMKEVSEELVLAPARRANPGVNVIIKFPNWYDHYHETGYNLEDEPRMFDMVYTGTETRDPLYTYQHLPRYLGYFLMRYLENVKPGKNGGGWFDPYECKYNLNSYVEQANLTVFGKAREVTLFCLGSLLDGTYSLFAPAAGKAFEDLDAIAGKLGEPMGVGCYKPFRSEGEDYLYDYIGMLGIPLEPLPVYPSGSKNILLAETAGKDPEIVDKIEESLISGSSVMITSGLLRVLEDKGFNRIASIRSTGRKALADTFAISDNGMLMGDIVHSDKELLIPQLTFATNDAWQLASALGKENNFPILLTLQYGKGRLYILTVPEDFGDLYSYPREVLKAVRDAFSHGNPVSLDAPAKVALFTYDNGTFIVESFLQHNQGVKITVDKPNARLIELGTGKERDGSASGGKTTFALTLLPASYSVFSVK